MPSVNVLGRVDCRRPRKPWGRRDRERSGSFCPSRYRYAGVSEGRGEGMLALTAWLGAGRLVAPNVFLPMKLSMHVVQAQQSNLTSTYSAFLFNLCNGGSA